MKRKYQVEVKGEVKHKHLSKQECPRCGGKKTVPNLAQYLFGFGKGSYTLPRQQCPGCVGKGFIYV